VAARRRRSKERWLENKNPVMAKFQPVESTAGTVVAQAALADWDSLKSINEKGQAGRSGGFAKQTRAGVSPELPAAKARTRR